MATATSYDLSAFVGPGLFLKSDTPRSFLTAIGVVADFDGNESVRGLRSVRSNMFPLGVDYTLSAASQPSHLDGADATYSQTDTTSSFNVVQIFQYGVSLSYSAQSNVDQITQLGSSGSAVVPGGGEGPEQFMALFGQQFMIKLAQAKRDLNFTLLRGTYNVGAAGTARQTRGLRSALSTNVFANGGTPRALSTTIFETALGDMIANGAFSPGERIVALCPADQYGALIDLYASSTNQPRSFSVAGVMVRTIMTKYGVVDVMYESDLAAGELVLIQPGACRATLRRITSNGADRGTMILEPLAKTGSADNSQLYFEAGMDYGREWLHGVIDDLS